MEIQSAFNVGVQGFQKATEDANQAAKEIASNVVATSESYDLKQSDANQESNTITTNPNRDGTLNLNQSIVDLRVAEFQAKASAEVVESADENLGTLLDVRV